MSSVDINSVHSQLLADCSSSRYTRSCAFRFHNLTLTCKFDDCIADIALQSGDRRESPSKRPQDGVRSLQVLSKQLGNLIIPASRISRNSCRHHVEAYPLMYSLKFSSSSKFALPPIQPWNIVSYTSRKDLLPSLLKISLYPSIPPALLSSGAASTI